MSSNSSTGQILGYVVGAVVGYFTGGTGWALVGNVLTGAGAGGAIGGMLDPPKGPTLTGPRLGDLSVQTSTYGAQIPRIYGTVATMGNVFWLEGGRLKETITKKKSGGKGGGGGSKIKTYSYSATFAVGLCKGPIAGVRRIWVGSKLIYDAGAGDIESIIASNQAATTFRVYLGTEDQDPDPRMQADKGVANTPAYRGLAYIVLYDYQLADHGNSLMGAQVKVEVYGQSSVIPEVVQIAAPPGTFIRSVAHNDIGVSVFGTQSSSNLIISTDGGYTTSLVDCGVVDSWVGLEFDGGRFVSVGASAITNTISSVSGIGWLKGENISALSFNSLKYGNGVFCAVPSGGGYSSATSPDGVNWDVHLLAFYPALRTWHGLAFSGRVFCTVGFTSSTAAISNDGKKWETSSLPISASWIGVEYGNGYFIAVSVQSEGYVAKSSDGITWSFATPIPNGARWIKYANGIFVASSEATCYYSADNGSTWTFLPTAHGPCIFNGAWWIFGYGTNIFIWRPGYMPAVNQLPLSTIVSKESLQSDVIAPADLDTAALTQQVRGYRVTQTGAIRAAIEPLQSAWPFDVIQSGYKIKAVSRGGASVLTIDAALLDARPDGEAPGPQITIVREMDTQLPRRVSIKHLDVGREYDMGEQYAERISGESISTRAMEMPIVLTAGEAAAKAETLLYLYWLERHTIQFALPPEFVGLEPADVITITAPSASYEMRLTSINYLSDGRLECVARYNSAAIYAAAAVGEESAVAGGTVALAGPSQYVLLDIPALTADMDAPMFVAAMAGYTAGWPGGILFRSSDAGQTWDDLQGWTGHCTMGYARNTIGIHPGLAIDAAAALQVDLLAGDLESVSELAMLNGANHFAYGGDGRWEIMAARTCTLQGDGSYLLTDMLRGRFGTEHNTGNHAVGDVLVLLTDPDLGLIGMDSASIGLARAYRGITAGRAIDSDSDRSFTYRAVNLECFSPVYLNGNRHPSTSDWTLTWIRRTRISGEWRDQIDAPLSEASEAYEIEIYSSAAYTTVKRTLTSSTPTVAYTSAQQVADFGSNQATLYVRVYQMSATVGRGFPLQTSITR